MREGKGWMKEGKDIKEDCSRRDKEGRWGKIDRDRKGSVQWGKG